MTVSELIAILQQQDPAALIALHDHQAPGAIRELQRYEIKPVAVYRTHSDRAPRLDSSRGRKLQAVILGGR